MNDRRDTIARAITAFVEDPVTNLVKGIALFLIRYSIESRRLPRATPPLQHPDADDRRGGCGHGARRE
jgi:hypothetical protein